MKKQLFFAFMSTIVFMGTGVISSCSSGDSIAEQQEDNPNYNPVTGEVLTKFVFNIATGNTTRQSSAATQASSSDPFRGINSAVLLSFKQTDDGKHIYASGTADKRYDLQSIMSPGTISSTTSNRVIETSLPLNTNSLLFYGKATEPTTANYEAYGHLDDFTIADPASTGLDVSKTNIEVASRINGNLENFQKIEDLLGGILTCIMNSNLAGDHHTAVTFENQTVTYPDGIYWSSYVAGGKSPVSPTKDLFPLEVKLANVYKEMTNIRDAEGELRGGCAHNIIYTIQALWSVINEIYYAVPFCAEEAVAQALARHIHNRLKEYFNGTVPATGAQVTDVSIISSTDNVIDHFLADTAWPTTADARPAKSHFTSISSLNLNKFPEELYHVPAGSAHYLFDNTKKQFFYQQDYNTSAVGGKSGFNVASYYYPAELAYFGNSPIRTSSTQVRPNEYPNGVATWKDDASWDEKWAGTHVVSSTQAVAMKNNINYGTSLLQTTVGYSATELQDNNHAIQVYKDPSISDTDEPNKVITVTATSFQLKGVIIGGQSKKVGWNYLPKVVTDPETNPVGYVYDNTIVTPGIPATGSSAPNYTLVFDNYNASPTDGKQDKVYVALELINNTGQDFFGEYGLIRNGGTFYLIGELDPTDKAPTWANSDHPLPPYNADGTTNKVSRVFIQDYMTKANFVIGPTSLQHAYLTVPDLRYSSLTLGLSVDLNWETGIDFGNVILGATN